MAYIQLMGTRNELAAIPEGRCGFQSEQIRCGGDGEHHPSAKRIPEFEFFHCFYYCLYYNFQFCPIFGTTSSNSRLSLSEAFLPPSTPCRIFCTFVVPTPDCPFRRHFCRRQHHVVFFCTFVVPTSDRLFRRHFCRRQHRSPTAQRSYSVAVLQRSGPTAQRSYSEAVLQRSGPTAKRSYSEAVLQHRALTAQRSRSKKRPLPQIRCKITTFF